MSKPKNPPQVCIGSKNPAAFDLGLTTVAETPVRPRRWDGRFYQLDKHRKYACIFEGSLDHYGIGRYRPSGFHFTTACKIDTDKTILIKSGGEWYLKIRGLDSGGNPFDIWVGDTTQRVDKSIIGVYTRTGGTDRTREITIVRGLVS